MPRSGHSSQADCSYNTEAATPERGAKRLTCGYSISHFCDDALIAFNCAGYESELAIPWLSGVMIGKTVENRTTRRVAFTFLVVAVVILVTMSMLNIFASDRFDFPNLGAPLAALAAALFFMRKSKRD